MLQYIVYLLQTTEMANKDLEKYYKALDRLWSADSHDPYCMVT